MMIRRFSYRLLVLLVVLLDFLPIFMAAGLPAAVWAAPPVSDLYFALFAYFTAPVYLATLFIHIRFDKFIFGGDVLKTASLAGRYLGMCCAMFSVVCMVFIL